MGDAARVEDGDLGDRRASRLVGLGARVAAVAHEIKVPLSLIVGSLESLDGYVASLVERVAELEARIPEPTAGDARRRDHSHRADRPLSEISPW